MDRKPHIITSASGSTLGVLWLTREEQRTLSVKFGSVCVREIEAATSTYTLQPTLEAARNLNNLVTELTRPRPEGTPCPA